MRNQEYRLDGLTIAITRSIEQSAGVSECITSRGGSPCLLPAIEITSITSEENHQIFQRLDEFDWLIFTSSNAVNQTFDTLRQIEIEPGSLDSRLQIAVVGAQTEASIAVEGIHARVVANPANAATLLQTLRHEGVADSNILLPSSRIAGPELAQGLIETGAKVSVVPVYDTRCPVSVPLCAARRIRSGGVDVVTFASPSAVNNFISLVGHECLGHVEIACIGPTTAAAVETIGFSPTIVPEQASIDSLLRAISRSLVQPAVNGVETS